MGILGGLIVFKKKKLVLLKNKNMFLFFVFICFYLICLFSLRWCCRMEDVLGNVGEVEWFNVSFVCSC